jgi:hypothetical protein
MQQPSHFVSALTKGLRRIGTCWGIGRRAHRNSDVLRRFGGASGWKTPDCLESILHATAKPVIARRCKSATCAKYGVRAFVDPITGETSINIRSQWGETLDQLLPCKLLSSVLDPTTSRRPFNDKRSLSSS